MSDEPPTSLIAVPPERIEAGILLIRGQRVMLDSDLAELYGLRTTLLLRAVRRNPDRFPADFMFELTVEEFERLRIQIGSSKRMGRGGRRYPPYAFTEQGVAMLSSVLNSPRAVQVNIEIMRAFVRLRALMATHADLAARLDEMEAKYDAQFRVVFDAIRELMTPAATPGRKLGFKTGELNRGEV
ncbi:MAG: ORF6N domain-containing protein [Dehalococcoidia bacterium]